MLETKSSLKQIVEKRKNLREQSAEAYDDPEDFVLFCYVTKNPQAYGSILEKRIREKNGMTKVDPSEERGDAIDVDGNYKEIKCSLSGDGVFNAVQIRPHHNIYSCLMFFFEINESNDVVSHFFEIPESDLLKFPGISIAHGTKQNKNSKTEYRITFDKAKSDKNANTVAAKAWRKLQEYRITNKSF